MIFFSRARRKLIGGAALSAEKIALNCPEVGCWDDYDVICISYMIYDDHDFR